jgi:hypothetical protein
MRDVSQKWYDWLKEAVSTEKKELAHVYSDCRQLWATDGYRLHARQVATEKQGQVTLGETGLFEVTANGHLPDFAASLPKTHPTATVIVERDMLLQALAGQDNHVRLTFYDDDQALELSSAGAFALVMPLSGLEDTDFWRPEKSTE